MGQGPLAQQPWLLRVTGVALACLSVAAISLSLIAPPASAEPAADDVPIQTEAPVDPEAPSETEESVESTEPAPEVPESDDAESGDSEEAVEETHEEAEQPAPQIGDPATLSQSPGTPAAGTTARSTAGFQAGYIITDKNFYNGSAMTASQVQSFLNKRVAKPTSKSLSKYKQKTPTKKAASPCKAYAGKSSETAAQIIAKVGKACGISQQTLLVILQKEQSLVTTVNPSTTQYNRAMGYACPDTGKNNSAKCDSNYYGFFNQVYHAAKRLKQYGTGSSTWIPVGKSTTRPYHPNTKCGTKKLTVENKATAALYYYTPYTPNSAALSGKGNSCSTWGNLNFYTIYKSWFSSPNTYFSDVLVGHKYFTPIEWMGRTGLSRGSVPANGGTPRYLPDSALTRGQMAVFLYRLNGRPKVKLPKTSPFADVKPSHSYYPAIMWMYQEGIAKGSKQKTGKLRYGINNRLTRGHMAVFLYRMDGTKYKGPTTSPFSDVSRSHPYYNAVAWMHKEKLAKGVQQPNGKPRYALDGTMSREWMAVFIYRYKK